MSVYEQLAAQVRPVLTHYRDDLEKWDRQAIEKKHPGVPFLHWACSSSTHIVMLVDADSYPPAGKHVPYLFGTADREHILRQSVEYAKYFLRPEGQRADGYLVHHYDGTRLRQITCADALVVAESYRGRIQREWRRVLQPA